MKRYISMILAVFLLAACLLTTMPKAYASEKKDESKAIAIVFDNSGSMYMERNPAWSRATYAMEVFASMLNHGDVLQIYPMHPITAGGNSYSMQNPLQVTDSSQASIVRDIFTPDAGGTPLESIDSAAEGLRELQFSKKYLIILTDGGTFDKNGSNVGKERTKKELDKRIQANAGEDMTVMYLGIDAEACMPDTAQSEFFVKKKAANSADVLSTLTDMCNLVFGRDSLPQNRFADDKKTIEFDVSMSKLILFVQGENISDVKLTGASVGTQVSAQQTMYSTNGAGDYKSVPDTSLQGMLVTYEDCAAGVYNIEYTGTATSVEIYYELDADLEFVFTDAAGNTVDPQALYEGDYKVSFGMKDAKTGELISSDLLGNPHYQGSYFINGNEVPFSYDGYSGEVQMSLKVNDTFKANLTVTYLSGYTISKDSSDFGWPDSGVQVVAPPLGKFQATVKVQQDYIVIDELEQSETIVVALTINGRALTAEEFAAVTLDVDCGGVAYTVTPREQDSSYLIQLLSTEGIEEGNYRVSVVAKYADAQLREAQSEDWQNVTLSNTPLWVKWAIGISLLFLLILLIVLIARIRVLPSHANVRKKESKLIVDSEDVAKNATFNCEMKKDLEVITKYGGKKFGFAVPVKPGKESFLYKKQTNRYAETQEANTVSKRGNAVIEKVTIGSVNYILNEDTNKIERKPPSKTPIKIKHGTPIIYSGTITSAGIKKSFNVNTKINVKKK